MADEVIERLPRDYEQMLGRRFESGMDLSGGEWQKIALARAYLRDAQVLILDEPTAALDARSEFEVFQRFAELTAGKSALFISHRFSTVRMADDEVFADYAESPPGRPAWPPSLLAGGDADDAPLGFVLSGLSKLLGLPQLKLAWVVVTGPARLRDEALARLEVVADTYLSVSAPAALVAPELLQHADAVQAEIAGRVRENLARLDSTLEGVECAERLPRDGGWYALLRIGPRAGAPAPDEDALVAALLEHDGVLVQPGWLFELEDEEDAAHLVLSLLPAPGVFAPALEALARRLSAA